MKPEDHIHKLIKNTKIKTNPKVNKTELNDLLGRLDFLWKARPLRNKGDIFYRFLFILRCGLVPSVTMVFFTYVFLPEIPVQYIIYFMAILVGLASFGGIVYDLYFYKAMEKAIRRTFFKSPLTWIGVALIFISFAQLVFVIIYLISQQDTLHSDVKRQKWLFFIFLSSIIGMYL